LGPSGCELARPKGCIDLQSAHDDQSHDHTLNLVFVSVGTAALASAGALMLWPALANHRMALVTSLSSRGGGVELRGDF
jgi:hypothetical protein